jgi:SRSO17 transposase
MALMEMCEDHGSVSPVRDPWAGWSQVIVELNGRIADRFARKEVRERAQRYVLGLLDRIERKNSWQVAEAIGEGGPQGVQRLINGAVWDVEGVRDDLRHFVLDHLGEASSGLLIVDETGFLKKGTHSCGVARQYTGTAGGTENAQVGVFLAYASAKGTAFIDRALYLPRAWTSDAKRRAAAGIPKHLRFATKLTLAQRMLQRAFDAHAPAAWVVADSGYGRSNAFRAWLERRGRAYVLMVPKTAAVEYGGRRERVEQLGERIPAEAWAWICPAASTPSPAPGCPPSCVPAGLSTQPYQWVCLALSAPCPAGKRRWLLIRRGPDDPSELAYYLAYGPVATTALGLVRVAHARWAIEEGFAQAKGEVGLDHYEVRTWQAWHRFITLALLAHAALVVLQAQAVTAEADAAKRAAVSGSAQRVDGQKGGRHALRPLHPRSSRLRCQRSAGACWRCASRRRGGPFARIGRDGDGPTKRWPPAATPSDERGGCAGTRQPVPLPIPRLVPRTGVGPCMRPCMWPRIRLQSRRPWCTARSPMPNGSASCPCSRRSGRRLGVPDTTTAQS